MCSLHSGVSVAARTIAAGGFAFPNEAGDVVFDALGGVVGAAGCFGHRAVTAGIDGGAHAVLLGVEAGRPRGGAAHQGVAARLVALAGGDACVRSDQLRGCR